MKHFLACLVTGSLFLHASVAKADQSASATTSSDIRGEVIDIHLDFKPGAIDTPSRLISAGGSYISSTSGAHGYSGNIELRKKYIINSSSRLSSAGDGTVTSTLMVDPALKGRFDATSGSAATPGVNRVEAQGAEVALLYGQTYAGHETPENQVKRESIDKRGHELFNKLQNASDRRSTLYFQCEQSTNGCADYLKQRYGGATLEQAKMRLAAEEKALEAERVALMAEARAAGFEAYNDHPWDLRYKVDEVSATADTRLVSVNGLYQDFKDIGLKQYGAQFKLAESSFHLAGRVNGANFDFCGQIVPLAVVAGHVEGKDNHMMSMAKLCAGVVLGPVGHLQGSVSGASDFTGYNKVAVDVELKKVAGTPLSVGYTHEYETGRDGIEVRRNLIGGKLVF